MLEISVWGTENIHALRKNPLYPTIISNLDEVSFFHFIIFPKQQKKSVGRENFVDF